MTRVWRCKFKPVSLKLHARGFFVFMVKETPRFVILSERSESKDLSSTDMNSRVLFSCKWILRLRSLAYARSLRSGWRFNDEKSFHKEAGKSQLKINNFCVAHQLLQTWAQLCPNFSTFSGSLPSKDENTWFFMLKSRKWKESRTTLRATPQTNSCESLGDALAAKAFGLSAIDSDGRQFWF